MQAFLTIPAQVLEAVGAALAGWKLPMEFVLTTTADVIAAVAAAFAGLWFAHWLREREQQIPDEDAFTAVEKKAGLTPVQG